MATSFYRELLEDEETQNMSGSGMLENNDQWLIPIIIAVSISSSLIILLLCLICCCVVLCVVVRRTRRRKNMTLIENMPKFRVLDAPNPSFNQEGSGEHIPLTDSTCQRPRSSKTTNNNFSSSEYSYANPNEFRIIPGMRISARGIEETEEYVYARSVERGSTKARSQTLPSSPPRVASPYSIPLPIAGKYGSVTQSPSPPLPMSPKKALTESSPPSYESHYMTPATDKESLYAQINSLSVKQISRQDIVTLEVVGTGNFGLVWKGLWNIEPDPEPVAIKTLKSSTSTTTDIIKFLQEAAIMGQFHHTNVIQLHGVVTIGEPIMIVLELMELGDLRQYLITKKEESIETIQQPSLLLSFCRQVASGMDYLSKKSFVHRDLAARNIFLRNDLSCKIGDFGLARDLMDEEYYISTGGKIPIKWTSPEALTYRKYSSASDVWSYGVLLFEIWSLGLKPFKGSTNQETLRLIESGYRLPPPTGCPRSIYEIMTACWNPETSDRPSFEALHSLLLGDEMTLLKWSQEDMSIHPNITILGEDLSITATLYMDLQTVYKS